MEVYHLFWDEFSAWFLELVKPVYGQAIDAATYQATLSFFNDLLHLLHPFMPFITEEIYQAIPHDTESIMVSEWCKFDESLTFEADETEMEKIMASIRAIRNRRAEMNIPPSKKSKVYIETSNIATFSNGVDFVKRLAYANEVEVNESFGDLGNVVTIITDDARVYIPLYALKMNEKWVKKNMEAEKVKSFGEWYYEVTSDTPWNYALSNRSFSKENIQANYIVEKSNCKGYPWNVENAPVHIKTKARRLNNWTAVRGSAGPIAFYTHCLSLPPLGEKLPTHLLISMSG